MKFQARFYKITDYLLLAPPSFGTDFQRSACVFQISLLACALAYYTCSAIMDISAWFEDVRRMNKRQVKYFLKYDFSVMNLKKSASSVNRLIFNPQLFYQGLNFAMIVSSALMIWKGLMVVTGSESPIVVVLR